jgi:hypothetical protein
MGGAFFLIAFLLVISCEKDEIRQDTLENHEFEMKASLTSLNNLKRHRSNVHDISYNLATNSGIRAKSGSSSSLALDTTNIIVTEGLDYKNYIFRVLNDSTSNPDELKNYMLVVLKDSIQHQYTITYPLYPDRTVDTTNVRIEPFFGTNVTNYVPPKCGGGSYQSTWVPGAWVDLHCGHYGGNSAHNPGDACTNGDYRAVRLWIAGHFTTQYVKQEPCADLAGDNGNIGVITGGNTAPGGNNNNNNSDDGDVDDNTDQSDDSIEVGIVPNKELANPDRPEFCDEIIAKLNDPDYRAKLNEVNTLQVLARNRESGFSEHDTGQKYRDGTNNNQSDILDIVTDSTTIGYTHTHQNEYVDLNNTDKSYIPIKIFSPKDIFKFEYLLRKRASLGKSLDSVYGRVVSTEAIFTIKFKGNASEIPNTRHACSPAALATYHKRQEKLKLRAGFLRFLKNQNIDKFEIYETDRRTMETKKIEIDPNAPRNDLSKIKETPC